MHCLLLCLSLPLLLLSCPLCLVCPSLFFSLYLYPIDCRYIALSLSLCLLLLSSFVVSLYPSNTLSVARCVLISARVYLIPHLSQCHATNQDVPFRFSPQENPSCTSFKVNWESRFTGRVILDDTAGDLPVVNVKVSFTLGQGASVVTGTRMTDEDGYFTIHIVVCYSHQLPWCAGGWRTTCYILLYSLPHSLALPLLTPTDDGSPGAATAAPH